MRLGSRLYNLYVFEIAESAIAIRYRKQMKKDVRDAATESEKNVRIWQNKY